MISHARFALRAFILILAVLLCSCGSGSGSDVSENQSVGKAGTSNISVTISLPSSAGVIDTLDSSMYIAGSASSNLSVLSVSWSNDRGGNGTADGTNSWQIDHVSLELGENKITVTAKDSAGSSASRSIVVNRESGQGGSATLSWDAPSERNDGSPLTNLAGFKIYYGRMSGIYDYRIVLGNPGIVTFVVENLVSGNWYFAVSAFDSNGYESERSNEVNKRID